MKRILLTGASGFIGRACVRPLLARGFEIHTISRVPANVPPGVIAHHGDLLDRNSMRRTVAAIAPSHLLHAAWDVSHGGYWTSRANLSWLSASIDLLEAFIAAEGRRAVGVGTCAEYEWDHIPVPGVSSQTAPLTPYGGTKLALSDAFLALRGMGIETAWARIFYPYGPGERDTKLLSAVINALLDGRDINCSDGTQVRDFIHVDDVGAALAHLVDANMTGAIDIGTGQGTPLRSVLQEAISQLGHGELIHFGALPNRETEPPTLVANPKRLKEELRFTPMIGIPQGIADLVASIRATRCSDADHAEFPAVIAAIDGEIAGAAPIYHPSRFWVMLQDRNRNQLGQNAMQYFKRTINNNYFNWLPGDFTDNQVRNLMRSWLARGSHLPLAAIAGSSTRSQWSDVEAYHGDNPFDNEQYCRFYALFVGMLWDFAASHDPIGLCERIEEPLLGAPLPVYADGKLLTQDLANSIHEWSRVRQMVQGRVLPDRPRVLELGAGYGRLAYVFVKAEPCRYVIVDIAPALAIAQWYLTEALPGLTVFRFRQFDAYEQIATEFEAADLCFLSANQLELLPDDVIDISVSISSLHEMRHEQIEHFKQLIADKTRFAVYFKQWSHWKKTRSTISLFSGRTTCWMVDWRLILDTPHAVQDAFVELGFVRDHTPPEASAEEPAVTDQSCDESAVSDCDCIPEGSALEVPAPVR